MKQVVPPQEIMESKQKITKEEAWGNGEMEFKVANKNIFNLASADELEAC